MDDMDYLKPYIRGCWLSGMSIPDCKMHILLGHWDIRTSAPGSLVGQVDTIYRELDYWNKHNTIRLERLNKEGKWE